jgi:chromosomal replication initiator protein
MKDNNVREFRNKYRTIDVLLLDDVQFFQKGKAVQEEFFNTFNALQQAKKQIVMTSDVAPKNLPSIEARLISRFEGGMLQEIESPSYETRLAILKKKAEGIDINVPISTLEFIADNIKSHVRAMEGALGKVSVFLSSFNGTTLNNEILSHLLKDFIEKEQSLRKLSIEEIQTAVAKKYNVSIAQILSAERTQSIVTPRQLSMYIARKFTTKSLPEIAKLFDKTHATIIHGVRNIEKRLDVESDLKVTLSEILSEFGYKLSDKMD